MGASITVNSLSVLRLVFRLLRVETVLRVVSMCFSFDVKEAGDATILVVADFSRADAVLNLGIASCLLVI